MKALFNKMSHSKYTRPLLILLLALVVLVLLGSLAGLLDNSQPSWEAPPVSTATIQPSPTPGWWNELPTPLPVKDREYPDNGELP